MLSIVIKSKRGIIEVVDKITLKVGESSIEIAKNEIKLKAKRINLN
ncbi:hypothetical protein [Wolbachia phage WO]|nr:hypothetical protein [Wolbachia phage WO]